MMNLLKQIIPYKYKRKIKDDLGVPSLHWSLLNLKKIGFNPCVIIDIGAYEGYWTLDVLEVFPDARVLMVEPQKKKEIFLMNLTKNHNKIDYSIELLSATDGIEKLFVENETASHIVEHNQKGIISTTLYTKTLDTLLEQKGLPHPDFIKLDVQGHEMEVLRGAEKSLSHCEICLLEITLLNIGGDTPLLQEMVSFMNEKNFQAYDIT
jgi:FkbM family methyltransferase